MRSARRCGAIAISAILVASCALAPLAETPSPSPGSSPQPTSASAPPATSVVSPSPTPGPSASPPPTAITPSPTVTAPTQATPPPSVPPDLDLASAAWFQWLSPPDGWPGSLYVGRLDGRAFKVIDSGTPVFIRGTSAGPVHGMVLTTWQSTDEQMFVDLVDTASGQRTNITSAPAGTRVYGAIDPAGVYAYWIPTQDGTPAGLWRQPIAGGPAEQVLAGQDVPGEFFYFALDGKHVALAGCNAGCGTWQYAVYDADFRLLGQLQDSPYGEPVGFLGPRLVVYPHLENDESLRFPLFALAVHDWSAEKIVTSEGVRAAIVPDADGTPRLLFDGHDDKDHYTLNVLDPGGATRRLFVGDVAWDEWYALLDGIVWPTTSSSIEAPGWVATFSRDALTTESLAGADQGSRQLVRISDGTVADVPALSVQP